MIALLLKYRIPIHILFAVLTILGAIAFLQLGREELPYVVSNSMTIRATLPGASPEEIDLYVARPVAHAVRDLPGVEHISTQSKEEQFWAVVSFIEGDKEPEALVREVSQIIDQIPDMPQELLGPYYSRPPIPFPVMLLSFKGGDDLSRHIAWKKVEERLNQVPDIERLEIFGDRERQIEVRFDPVKLKYQGLRLDKATEAVRDSMINRSAGSVEATMGTRRLRALHQPDSVAALQALPLAAGTSRLRLNDVAEVRDTLKNAEIKVRHNDEPAWYIRVHRKQGANVTKLSANIHSVLAQYNQEAKAQGLDFNAAVLHDYSQIVTDQLDSIGMSAIQGILLVIIVLWLFIGVHDAFVAAVGIPVSFLIGILGMNILGVTLNVLTLFGFTLVSGMVVDDAIVVVENVARHREKGMDPLSALRFGIKEVWGAVFASTFTTIAAFFSLLVMTGVMSDFLSLIPKVVILVLLASLLECFVLLPLHMTRERKHKASTPLLVRPLNWLGEKLTGFTHLVLRYRYISLVLSLLGFLFTGWVAARFFNFQFFLDPVIRAPVLHLEVAQDVDLTTMDRLLARVGKDILAHEPDVADLVTIAGWSDWDYNQRRLFNLGSLQVIFKEESVAAGRGAEVLDRIKARLAQIPGTRAVRVTPASNQPPVGTPIRVQLYGNDAGNLSQAVTQVKQILQEVPGIYNIDDPLANGIPEMRLIMDAEKIRRLGLTPSEVGELLYNANTGRKVGKMDMVSEVVDIYVKLNAGGEQGQGALEAVTLADGQAIALSRLGHLEEFHAPESIERWDSQRYLALTAEVDEDQSSVFLANQALEKQLAALALPPGISFEQEGQFARSRASVLSLLNATLLSIGLIYVILAFLFRSYFQPILVLLVIPMALTGVVWGLALGGGTLTVLGFTGIIGLCGIVVNDALVWVSIYNQRRQDGHPAMTAALTSVRERFRPIMLTTFTTVIGLIPLASNPDAGLINLAATTIVWGLSGATLIMLVCLPLFSLILDDLTRLGKAQKPKKHPRNPPQPNEKKPPLPSLANVGLLLRQAKGAFSPRQPAQPQNKSQTRR